MGMTEIKEYNREEEIELNIKYMVGGELADLLLLTGIGDPKMDWELRARVFEAEIIRLNEIIEKLGGPKSHYIRNKEEAEKFAKEHEEFEKEHGDKIKEIVSKLVIEQV